MKPLTAYEYPDRMVTKEKAMARKIVILPDEMDNIIEGMSNETGATASEVIRRLLAAGLKEHGFNVNAKVKAGGKREGAGRPKQEKQPA